MDTINPFVISIYDDSWNIYLIEDDDNVISDEGSAAHTDFDSKEIFVRRGHLSLNLIKHEIWHAFFGYAFLSDTTEMTLRDIEEVSASLFEYKSDRMLKVSEEIYYKLLEVRDKNET